MDLTEVVRMQLLSAPLQLAKEVSTCLHFSTEVGVQPVPQQKRLSTNMAKATIAKMTVKEVHGQTMFTSFKVNIHICHLLGRRSVCVERPQSLVLVRLGI